MGNLKKQLSDLIYLIKPFWKYGKIYIIVTLISAGLIAPLAPITYVLLTQKIVDVIASQEGFMTAIKTIVFLYGANMGVWLVRTGIRELYLDIKREEIKYKINKDIYMQGIYTDYKYFDNPEYYDNYTWAATEYAEKSSQTVDMLASMVTACSTIGALIAIIFSAGPVIIVLSIVQLIITTIIETKRNKIIVNRQEETIPFDRRINYVHRTMYSRDNIQDIKTTNIKNYLIDSLDTNIKKKILTNKKYVGKIFSNSVGNVLIAFFTESAIMIYICYGIIVSKSITGAGMFLSMFYAAQNLVSSLQDFFSIIVSVNEFSLYADKIRIFFNLKSNIECKNSDTDNLNFELVKNSPFGLHLNNVSFGYPNSNFKLNNINLKVRPGEKIAIVGENGAGKSTLAKLLLRLYDVDEGQISYNNCDIKTYNIASLRHAIGIAFQHPQIYALPFYQNLSMYRKISERKLKNIVNQVELLDTLKKNEANLKTEVTREFDESGIMLSGGEMQKLSIARLMTSAYSDEFGLILLDEPSSALDPLAEYKLSQILLSKSNKTTTIIISHRLSTIRNVDRIYVLSNGEIVEKGTHDELMRNNGIYCEMFTKQAENYIV